MAKKKYLQLPKEYLSQSQISIWERSPDKYATMYFDGDINKTVYNDSMGYGKEFADALENYENTDNLLTDAAILLLQKYDVRDQEMFAELKTKHGWIKLLAKPDTFNSKTCEFREYKTGKVAWTQNKANKHFQLFFYAAVIYLKHGVVLDHCYLDWIETAESVITDPDDFLVGTMRVQPTGKIKSFKVEVGLPKILETLARIIKAAKEIEIAYASHIKN